MTVKKLESIIKQMESAKKVISEERDTLIKLAADLADLIDCTDVAYELEHAIDNISQYL